MSEVILYAVIALGLSGFTFILYLKNLSKATTPEKTKISSEDEEVSRILKIQELELQKNKKNNKNISSEIRRLENPQARKDKFKSSYERTFPDRDMEASPIQQQNLIAEHKIEATPSIEHKNENTLPSITNNQSIEEENLKQQQEERQIAEKLRIDAEKRARAEAVRQNTLQGFLHLKQKREELYERERARKERESQQVASNTLFS